MLHLVDAADKNRQKGTDANDQSDGREIYRFYLGEVNRTLPIGFTVIGKKTEHRAFLYVRFNHTDPGIRLLGIGGEFAELGLDALTFPVDDGIHVVDGHGKDGQRSQNVQA